LNLYNSNNIILNNKIKEFANYFNAIEASNIFATLNLDSRAILNFEMYLII